MPTDPNAAVIATGAARRRVRARPRAGNLERHPQGTLTARAPAIDIVIEGPASWVGDRHLLEKIAAAYDSKYGWPVTITADGMFDAPYGAPTAGPPPYRAYAITPRAVYAFGTDDDLGIRSTRFRFSGG